MSANTLLDMAEKECKFSNENWLLLLPSQKYV